MNSDTNNMIAIVTGASRGIGASIAKQLGVLRYKVIVNYNSGEEAAKKVVSEIEAEGGQAYAIKANVANRNDVVDLFNATEEKFGTPNILINSAGVMFLSPLSEIQDDQVDTMIDVNFKGTLNTMREASKRMTSGATIVNLSTSVVGLKLPNYSVYAATKAAVETMTSIFAKELRGQNITVNSIAPGPTATELFLEGKSAEQIAALANLSPLQRIASPEDIANVIVSITGASGSWINGQNIRVNGGIV